ncbi:hypothetical protein FB451DRAFT_1171747 [Mycena latifolia]|nr:hypothetical protein FB451DRAFT_1171747 [Mycena latifolia]
MLACRWMRASAYSEGAWRRSASGEWRENDQGGGRKGGKQVKKERKVGTEESTKVYEVRREVDKRKEGVSLYATGEGDVKRTACVAERERNDRKLICGGHGDRADVHDGGACTDTSVTREDSAVQKNKRAWRRYSGDEEERMARRSAAERGWGEARRRWQAFSERRRLRPVLRQGRASKAATDKGAAAHRDDSGGERTAGWYHRRVMHESGGENGGVALTRGTRFAVDCSASLRKTILAREKGGGRGHTLEQIDEVVLVRRLLMVIGGSGELLLEGGGIMDEDSHKQATDEDRLIDLLESTSVNRVQQEGVSELLVQMFEHVDTDPHAATPHVKGLGSGNTSSRFDRIRTDTDDSVDGIKYRSEDSGTMFDYRKLAPKKQYIRASAREGTAANRTDSWLEARR